MSSPTFRPIPAGSGSGDMTKAVYDTDDDGKVDSAKTLDGFDSADFASRTASDLTLYVYEDATGDADGSSKANAYTTLQDAIDAIPDVAQNVTVIVSKGSTNYLGQTTTIQKASVKSLTIKGEFYAYEACDANAVAGKIVDASADFSDFEVGDRVVCTHYSGTVGSSSIDDYFYATITEVGSGYVQTSESTKVPTTGWRYLINQTVFDGNNNAASPTLITTTTFNKSKFVGICIEKHAYNTIGTNYNSENALLYCILYDVGNVTNALHESKFEIRHSALLCKSGSYVRNSGDYSSSYVVLNSIVDTISGTPWIAFVLGESGSNNISVKYSGIFNQTHVVRNYGVGSAFLHAVYISSTCTYGAYGYNITLSNCTNNATTPVYNLTSGGSIEEWDGQALPSIDDATGGQVLRLKSDKSALEFATVSGGGIAWTEVTGTSQAASVDNGYIANNVAIVTVTLPSTCAVGKTIRVAGKGSGLWKIAQNESQIIYFGDQNTTSGTAGYLAAQNQYDSIELLCITANTTFNVISAVGNITVV